MMELPTLFDATVQMHLAENFSLKAHIKNSRNHFRNPAQGYAYIRVAWEIIPSFPDNFTTIKNYLSPSVAWCLTKWLLEIRGNQLKEILKSRLKYYIPIDDTFPMAEWSTNWLTDLDFQFQNNVIQSYLFEMYYDFEHSTLIRGDIEFMMKVSGTGLQIIAQYIWFTPNDFI